MLSKLSENEKMALAGVVKWVVSADPQDSIEGLKGFFQEHNFGDFDEVYNEMNNRYSCIEELQEDLKAIENVEARKLIVDVAKDIAISDVHITKGEEEIINYLKSLWSL